MAAVLQVVPPCLQPRAQRAVREAAAGCSARGEEQDALACCVQAVLEALPRVELGDVTESIPCSYHTIYFSPRGTPAEKQERLAGVLEAVAGGALEEEALYRELEGLMYPRWHDDLPWYVRAQRQGN